MENGISGNIIVLTRNGGISFRVTTGDDSCARFTINGAGADGSWIGIGGIWKEDETGDCGDNFIQIAVNSTGQRYAIGYANLDFHLRLGADAVRGDGIFNADAEIIGIYDGTHTISVKHPHPIVRIFPIPAPSPTAAPSPSAIWTPTATPTIPNAVLASADKLAGIHAIGGNYPEWKTFIVNGFAYALTSPSPDLFRRSNACVDNDWEQRGNYWRDPWNRHSDCKTGTIPFASNEDGTLYGASPAWAKHFAEIEESDAVLNADGELVGIWDGNQTIRITP